MLLPDPEPRVRLFVGNLPYSYTDSILAEIFSVAGPVLAASVVVDRETGRSKGFGFVEMRARHEAEAAISALHDAAMDGRTIVVNEARPREERPRGNVASNLDQRSWDNLNALLDAVPERVPAPTLDADQLRELLRSTLHGQATKGLLRPGSVLGETADRKLSELVGATTSVDDETIRVFAQEPELLYHLTSRRFEEVVAEILRRLGFNHVQLTPATRDGGVDIYASKDDVTGTSLYIIECKLWKPERKVGLEVLQRLYGVLLDRRATKAIVATTTTFSRDAKKWHSDRQHQMALRDYEGVRAWLDQCVNGPPHG